ncbi:MAG: cupin [Cenarchaeum symbiont of Oopsacas minuta]|nr:cupin [Cenarchaeum symbiont of Oopsacas minuta]
MKKYRVYPSWNGTYFKFDMIVEIIVYTWSLLCLIYDQSMKVEFDVHADATKILKSGKLFHTFFSKDTLECGILCLKKGQKDTQEPHDADEVYYVISGDGYVNIRQKTYAVSPGKAFFVPAGASHNFSKNTRDLVVLYFFGAS